MYFGMHAYWWIFWIIIWFLFLGFMVPVRRTRWRAYRQMETPIQVLQRRYAAGEITSGDYEERKAKLLRDANTR